MKDENQVVVYDETWFSRLLTTGDLNDADWLTKHAKISPHEKRRFINNEVENPRIRYAAAEDFTEAKSRLAALHDDIKAKERNEFVKDLYIGKIESDSRRLALYSSAATGNVREFFAMSMSMYGKPKKKFFAYIASKVRLRLQQDQPFLPKTSRRRLEDVFSKINTAALSFTADVLPPVVVDDGKGVSAQTIKNVFDEVLSNYNIEDWEVVIDKEGKRPRFSVNAQQRVVHVPGAAALERRSRPITLTQAKALAEHEVGVHARRAYNGIKQPLRLLGVGLEGYLQGEEGLASYMQQQVEGAEEFYGFDRYLAASLAIGLDGAPRDFREVFVLMHDYYLLVLPDNDTKQNSAINASWDTCTRIFRGTTGHEVGLIYSRDISYFEGNIKMWDFISERPQIFEELFVGKFNPFDQKQVVALQALGILSQW